jgi:hypothetical protein
MWPQRPKRLDADTAKLISDGLALYEQELAEVSDGKVLVVDCQKTV